MRFKYIFVIFISIVMCLCVSRSVSQTYNKGGRSAAMSHASVALCDLWSVFNNQAALAEYNKIGFAICYDDPFLIDELSRKSAACIFPVGSGVFGLTYDYYGFLLYNEQKAGLAYSKILGKHISAGIQLDYLSTRIAEDYGSNNVFTFEAGILVNLNKKLKLGVHVFNPIRAKKSSKTNEKYDTVFKLGVRYYSTDKLIFCIEAEKQSVIDVIIKAGTEYKVHKKAFLRFGISSNPFMYSFGFGLNFSKIKLDFASSVHAVLGYSPQISLSYKIK